MVQGRSVTNRSFYLLAVASKPRPEAAATVGEDASATFAAVRKLKLRKSSYGDAEGRQVEMT
jgi:hypothetical protein